MRFMFAKHKDIAKRWVKEARAKHQPIVQRKGKGKSS
jgi:hypothetical protein